MTEILGEDYKKRNEKIKTRRKEGRDRIGWRLSISTPHPVWEKGKK